MTPQKQAFLHNPAEGTFGDCVRTCLASILDLERDTVPNFAEEHWENAVGFRAAMHEWLTTQGLRMIELPYQGEAGLGLLLDHLNMVAPDMNVLLSGCSKNGTNHMVIARNGEIVWDTSIDASGIVGPCDDGYFWITFLISLRFVEDDGQQV